MSDDEIAMNLIESLDKWDKTHINTKKSKKKVNFFESKTITESDNNSIAVLSYKQKTSRNLKHLKTQTQNANIQNFYKKIEEENSNILAQNLNIIKDHFNFDIFKSNNNENRITKRSNTFLIENNNNNNIKKTLSSTIKKFSKQKSLKKQKNDELLKIGNEIGIVKKDGKIKKGEDEVNIENRMLSKNGLILQGNYEKVISFDLYKGIVDDKRKIEKIFHDEILNLKKQIENKEFIIKKITEELENNQFELENKKNVYFNNQDAFNLIKIQIEKINSTISDYKIIHKFKKKFKEIQNEYEKSLINYKEQKNYNKIAIPKLKFKLKSQKNEFKSLKENLNNLIKENVIYFKNLLKEGIDVRNVGLCWILFRLNELNAKVDKNDFPKFLDYNSIEYLMKYSEKIIKINKLKILYHLIKTENQKNIEKNLLKNDPYHRKSVTINSLQILPNVNNNPTENIQKAFIKFDIKFKNKFAVLNDYYNKKDKEFLDNQLMNIKNVNLSKSLNDFNKMNENKIKNYKENGFIESLLIIQRLMNETENEIKEMRNKHLRLFKKKFESMKLKGTSECIKYDLMFCANFGNYAVC
jgi:hypothetical protein